MESFFIAGEMSRNRANFGHRRRKIQCPESEPVATSDTEGENPVPRVRTWANFGHRRRKSSAQSQNQWQLRTQEEKIQCPESEPVTTSDTGGENPVPRVRTSGNFGHRRRKSSDQSQNLDHLRTREEKIQCSESEPGPTSDTKS